jgi:hypothetical protein
MAMDRTLRKIASFEEAKNKEYRHWQSVSPEERIAAAWALSIEQYRSNGIAPDGRGLKTTLIRFERA